MKKKVQLLLDHTHLVRRYLLWSYKSARENFERIERKTTQLIVDEYILNHLSKNNQKIPRAFKDYIAQKRKDELKLKFADVKRKKLHPQYVYLRNRLAAVEEAIKYFLGGKELKRISSSFEEEFTRRIMEARDH